MWKYFKLFHFSPIALTLVARKLITATFLTSFDKTTLKKTIIIILKAKQKQNISIEREKIKTKK